VTGSSILPVISFGMNQMTDEIAPKLVVFDCDGTLVDSQHNVIACMNTAFSDLSLVPPEEKLIRQYIGLNLEEAIGLYMPETSDEEMLARIVSSYKAAFFNLRLQPDHEEPLYPGTREIMDRLSGKGCSMAVATGKSLRGLNAVIERHGLEGRFISLQTPDHNPGKPHPQMIEKAMDDAGVGPDQTFMIGDTSFDMMLAKNAGCHAVGVNWGYHSETELLKNGADHLIDAFSDLFDIIYPD
jgi:phosphoglycolate phosphatase